MPSKALKITQKYIQLDNTNQPAKLVKTITP